MDSSKFDSFDRLPADAVVDVRTVALLFDVSVATAWRWARTGVLPTPMRINDGKKTRGATTRWRVGDLRRMVRKSTEEARAAAA